MAERNAGSVLASLEARYVPQNQIPLNRRAGRTYQSASFGRDPELARAGDVGSGSVPRRPSVSTPAAAPSTSMPQSAGSSSGNSSARAVAAGAGGAVLAGLASRLVGPLAREGIKQVTGDGSEGSVGGVGSAIGDKPAAAADWSGLPGGSDPVDMAGWGGEPVTALPELTGIEGAAKGADMSWMPQQGELGWNLLNALGGMAGKYIVNNTNMEGRRDPTGKSIGSSVGAIAGSFIPVPIVGTMLGAILGGAIGGQFGPMATVGPNAGAIYGMDPNTGQMHMLHAGGDNGGKGANAAAFGDRFLNAMTQYIDAQGYEFDPGAAIRGDTYQVGYYAGGPNHPDGGYFYFTENNPYGIRDPYQFYGKDLSKPMSGFDGRGGEGRTALEWMMSDAFKDWAARGIVRQRGTGGSLQDYQADLARQQAEWGAWDAANPDVGWTQYGGGELVDMRREPPGSVNGQNWKYGQTWNPQTMSWDAPAGAQQGQSAGQQPAAPQQQAQQQTAAKAPSVGIDRSAAAPAASAPAASAPAPSAPASMPSAPSPIFSFLSRREGGIVPGPGTPDTTQPVPATLHTGEFVMRPEAVQAYGVPLLEALNNMELPGLPQGALTQPPAFREGGFVSRITNDPVGATFLRPYPTPQAEPTIPPMPSNQGYPRSRITNAPVGATIFAGGQQQRGTPLPRPVPMPPAGVPTPEPAPMPGAAVPAPGAGPMPLAYPPAINPVPQAPAPGALPMPPAINAPPPPNSMMPPFPTGAQGQEMGAGGFAPPVPPAARPQAPMPRQQGGGGMRQPPRGADGPVGTDALNMLSLAAARGEDPTSDPRLRQADQNIRGAMANPPQYREGGLVMPPGGGMMPPDPFEAMMQGGGEGPGHEMMEGGEEGEEDPYAPPGMERPYADAECGPNPFMPEDQNQGVTGDQVMQNFQALPPEAQQMAMTILGGDPMISSALLAILGPAIEPLLAQAMKASAAPIAQQNALPTMLGMGGQPPMMG